MTRIGLAVAAALALAGCMGGGETAVVSESQLRQIVLQPSDLQGTWHRFDEGRQIQADSPPGERADPTRFGRIEGWKARYRRPGSAQTRGPLVVESRADLFEDAHGAERDFDAAVGGLESLGGTLKQPDLGNEARAHPGVGGGPGTVRQITVVWRTANVVGLLTANGFDGRFTLGDVLALARKQQARIARAAR